MARTNNNNKSRKGKPYKRTAYLRAYDLYLTGECDSANAIHEALKKIGLKASQPQVSTWMIQRDDAGLTWMDRKAQIISASREKSEEKAAVKYAVIYDELFDILFRMIPKVKQALDNCKFDSLKINELNYTITTLTTSLNQVAAFKKSSEKIYDPRQIVIGIIQIMMEEKEWRLFISKDGRAEKLIEKLNEKMVNPVPVEK